MRCAYGERFNVQNCEECLKLPHRYDIPRRCDIKEALDKLEQETKTDRVLGKTKISLNRQIVLVSEVRPWIPAQPGEFLQYRKLMNGMVIIELSKDDVGR